MADRRRRALHRADRQRLRAARRSTRSTSRSRSACSCSPRSPWTRFARGLLRPGAAIKQLFGDAVHAHRRSTSVHSALNEKRGASDVDGNEGQDSSDHRDRLVAASDLVHRRAARQAVLGRDDRSPVPRAVHRRCRGRRQRPGARGARHRDERRLPPRRRPRRPLVVHLPDRAARGHVRALARVHQPDVVVPGRHVAERDRRRLEVPARGRQGRPEDPASSSPRSGASRRRAPTGRSSSGRSPPTSPPPSSRSAPTSTTTTRSS